MHGGWTSPYLPILRHGNYTFNISAEESSNVATICPIGGIFGASAFFLMVDRVGRKNIIMYSSLVIAISWMFIGFATSVTPIMIGRFVGGACAAVLTCVLPMYMGEIAEPKTRGFLTSLCSVSIVISSLLINIFGALFSLDTAAFIIAAIPLLVLLIFPSMPESPYSYLMLGKVREAKRSLQILQGLQDVAEELDRIGSAVLEQNRTGGRVSELFTVRSNRKAFIIALGKYKSRRLY